MNIKLNPQKHRIGSSGSSFCLQVNDGSLTFELNWVGRSALHYNADHSTARFVSVAEFGRQIGRLASRLRSPRRRLTSTHWSRCWPPYRSAQRKDAYYLGSIYILKNEKRVRRFSFAFAPSLAETPVVCVSMGLDESVYLLPADFFEAILDALTTYRDS